MKKYERIIAAEDNYDTIVYNGITILMEDDGYAFDFVSQLLKKTYTHLNFDLMGAQHGKAISKQSQNNCKQFKNKIHPAKYFIYDIVYIHSTKYFNPTHSLCRYDNNYRSNNES